MSCFLLFTGKLLEQAKENVKAQGYNFVKGHSRRNTGESSGEQGKKRKKVAKDERQREIKSIKKVIDNISEQMKFKQLRLEKHNSLKEYGKCDTISEEIRNLMREKKIQEKQLTLLEKKESKSKWYHKKRKDQMKTTQKTMGTGMKGKSLLELWKSDSSIGSNTNDSEDTVILSSDNEISITSVNTSVQSEADQLEAQSQMADKEEILDSDSDLFLSSQRPGVQTSSDAKMSKVNVNPAQMADKEEILDSDSDLFLSSQRLGVQTSSDAKMSKVNVNPGETSTDLGPSEDFY